MKLFFRTEGSGSPIVIIHGLYGSSDNWLTIAKKLAADHQVYLIDQRNHGHSPNADEHTYHAMKNDLAEFFDEHQIKKAIIMGHSMGGKTAMCFAADYPEKVEKLIIVDIAPKDYFLLPNQARDYQHNNILKAMLDLDMSQIDSRKQIETHLNERIGDLQVVLFLLKNVQRKKESQHFEWRLNVPILYQNLDEIISGVNAKWFDDRLPIFQYPVLFIKGANSSYILPDDFASIRKIYPDCQIEEIPNAGHWLHAEQPQLFLEAVSKFIKHS